MASCCSDRWLVDGDGAVVLGRQTRSSVEKESRGKWIVYVIYGVEIYIVSIAMAFIVVVLIVIDCNRGLNNYLTL